jgi:hypothetical protein
LGFTSAFMHVSHVVLPRLLFSIHVSHKARCMYMVEGKLHKYLTFHDNIETMVQVKSKVKIVPGCTHSKHTQKAKNTICGSSGVDSKRKRPTEKCIVKCG